MSITFSHSHIGSKKFVKYSLLNIKEEIIPEKERGSKAKPPPPAPILTLAPNS